MKVCVDYEEQGGRNLLLYGQKEVSPQMVFNSK